MLSFSDFNLLAPIQNAVKKAGYQTPTPIQEQSIPHLLSGRDLLGIAQTGTGKTAAFALPILNHLTLKPRRTSRGFARTLVLTPTRELASQIAASFADYGQFLRLRLAVIYGGVGQQKQVNAMSQGVDVLVATPGRLLDLMSQGYVRLQELEIFVLDEADRMLDMGFIHDVRKVIATLPSPRQTLLFSATMPSDISSLARTILQNPVRIEATPPATTVETVEQRVMFVDKARKRELLCDMLKAGDIPLALIFTRTKYGANNLADYLNKNNIQADAIHGNKSQGARELALGRFRDGRIQALVATDIAARGIDVPGISHVINFDLPNEAENYIHRIGRTARAGLSGIAISLCEPAEKYYLRDIQRLVGDQIRVDAGHRFHSETAANAAAVNPGPDQWRPQRGAGARSGQPHQRQRKSESSYQGQRSQPGRQGHDGRARSAEARPLAQQGSGRPGEDGGMRDRDGRNRNGRSSRPVEGRYHPAAPGRHRAHERRSY
jgi:ATP-dependent RNA helicase RhlE